jgi:hypothetical protein
VARADFIDVDLASPRVGSQAFGGSLGEDFTVGSTPITITSLGAFDPATSATNGTPLTLADPNGIFVEIVNSSQAVVAGNGSGGAVEITSANSTQRAGSQFIFLNSFTPVTLTAGTYRLIAWGYSATVEENNAGSGGVTTIADSSGLISYPADNGVAGGAGNSFYNTTPGGYPINGDGSQTNRYGAGSFTFTPEPAALGLIAAGSFGWLIRRPRRHA